MKSVDKLDILFVGQFYAFEGILQRNVEIFLV
jgi:hypothetical protein